MSTRNTCFAVIVAAGFAAAAHAQTKTGGPGLGQPISVADAAPWDLSIQTDGSGLPPGSGTAAAGKEIFATQCVACHGAGGVGQPNDKLVGGQGTISQFQQVRTVGSYWPYATTVFDYTKRAMPHPLPQSLTNDEVYATTAYILYMNKIIGIDDEMNAKTLPLVKMPNWDGFIPVLR